jgi:hypothetical protein
MSCRHSSASRRKIFICFAWSNEERQKRSEPIIKESFFHNDNKVWHVDYFGARPLRKYLKL